MKPTRVTITINDTYNMSVELGHTEEEWNKLYGNVDELWDFLFEEFLDGSVEPMEAFVYWYINGRMYETDEEA